MHARAISDVACSYFLLQTMAQAGGMGSAGPATAESGMDETLEDYAKVWHAPGYLNGRQAEWCKKENPDQDSLSVSIALAFNQQLEGIEEERRN